MIKALWFFVKIAIVVGVVVWVAERPGTVKLEWLEYTFTVHVGVVLLGLLGLIWASIFMYRVVRALVTFPSSLRYYNEVKGREKGYRALTIGLTAIAAGDTRAALKQAEKARGLLPEGEGLPLLLEAQAARLDGREDDARESFVALLENKDASFLGVRGLLQASLDKGDTVGALRLARQALALHPKQGWILRSVYDLEIRNGNWSAASEILTRCVRVGAVRKERAARDRTAMALAIALEAVDEGLHDVAASKFKEAQSLADKVEGGFVAAPILYARYLLGRGAAGRKKAVSVVEKAWKAGGEAGGHAALVSVWGDLMAPATKAGKGGDALARLKWIERLVGLNPSSAQAHVAAGCAAMECGLWGEARQLFEIADALKPSAGLYKALAALEDKAGDETSEEAARGWIEKAADAPEDKVWVCRETGRVYDEWTPIAKPHGAFNTIEWAYGFSGENGAEDLVLLKQGTVEPPEALLETPKTNAA